MTKFKLYYFMEFEWHEIGSFDTYEEAIDEMFLDKRSGKEYRYRITKEENMFEG